MGRALQLIEPIPIEDDFCSGLAVIEDVGVGLRLVFHTQQTCYESNSQVLVVKRKLVLPVTAVKDGIQMTLGFLAHRMAKSARVCLVR